MGLGKVGDFGGWKVNEGRVPVVAEVVYEIAGYEAVL